MKKQKKEFETNLQNQKKEFETKLQNQQKDFEKQMNQMNFMLEQMKLLQKQPPAASESSSNENESEWFQFLFNSKKINKLITNYLLFSNSSFILSNL